MKFLFCHCCQSLRMHRYGRFSCNAAWLTRTKKTKSRAKKVGHMVSLKPQFFKGFKATTPNATTHTGSAAFVQADWVDLCHRLYPKTLTTLLNSQPTKMPKWMAKRWQPFQRLSAARKRLGKAVDVLLFCLRLCMEKSGGVMT